MTRNPLIAREQIKNPEQFLTGSLPAKGLSKTYAPKILQAALGPVGAMLVQHIWYATTQSEKFWIHEQNEHQWLVQSQAEMAKFLVVSKDTAFGKFGVTARLVDLGVVKQALGYTPANQKISLWRLDFDRLMLMMALTYKLYGCTREKQWLDFVCRNHAVVSSFTYHTATGEEALFAGVVTESMRQKGKKAKSFKNRTPLTLPKAEQIFAQRLQTAWTQYSKDALASAKDGQKGEVGNHPTPGWEPPHGGCLPPHPQGGAQPANTDLSLRVQGPNDHIEYIEFNTEKDTEREYYVLTQMPAASSVNSGIDNFGDDEAKDVVQETAHILFPDKLVRPEVVNKTATRLLDHWDEFKSSFETRSEYLREWAIFMTEHATRLRSPNSLCPSRQNQLWREFVTENQPPLDNLPLIRR